MMIRSVLKDRHRLLVLNKKLPFLLVRLPCSLALRRYFISANHYVPAWHLLGNLKQSSADSSSIDETCQDEELEKGKGNCQNP